MLSPAAFLQRLVNPGDPSRHHLDGGNWTCRWAGCFNRVELPEGFALRGAGGDWLTGFLRRSIQSMFAEQVEAISNKELS